MSSLELARALSIDHGVAVATDWSVTQYPLTSVSRESSCAGSRAIRRAIGRARSALLTMRLDEAAKSTGQLRRLLMHYEKGGRARYLCALRTLEASLHAATDRLSAARAVLTTPPSLHTDPMAAVLLRYLDWKQGQHDEGCMPDTMDYLAPPVGGKAIVRILSLCVSAGLAFDRLHLTVSSSLASEAFRLARERYGNHSAITSLPATLLAQVAYEQGRFEEAEALLRPRMLLMRTAGSLECVARASVLLARLSLHKGQRRAALAALRDAEALGQTRRWPRLSSIAALEYARALTVIRHEEGRHGESRALTGACLASHSLPTEAQLAMALRLRRMPGCAEGPGCTETHSFLSIEAALRHACSAASDGRLDDSFELLVHCLRIGAARGLRMIFVDAGRPCLNLLQSLYEALPTTEGRLAQLRPYVATLLRFAAPMNPEEPEAPTYRPLSRRETGILQMIARGLSNKRIAQSLGITPETVKSHAKSIFVKLDTRTRAQAVARAESIGLL